MMSDGVSESFIRAVTELRIRLDQRHCNQKVAEVNRLCD